MNNVNTEIKELKMYRINGPFGKKLDKILSKVDQKDRSDFMNIITCIDVCNALNISKELKIYLTKIKTDMNLAFTIDELIVPLEDIIKIYINFRKQVNNFTPELIIKLSNISIKIKDNIEIIKHTKKAVPSLLNDITKEEFIETIEKFNEKPKTNFLVNKNFKNAISKVEQTLNHADNRNTQEYDIKKLKSKIKDLKDILENMTQEDLVEFQESLLDFKGNIKKNSQILSSCLNKNEINKLNLIFDKTDRNIKKFLNTSNEDQLKKITNYQHYATVNSYHLTR